MDNKRGTCRECGRTVSRIVGCWCWECYCRIVDAAPCRRIDFGRGRARRVRRYRRRAALGLPLFGGAAERAGRA